MRAVLGLGSSLGDRRATLLLGLRLLAAAPGLELVATSRLYWSPAVGGVARASFLNAAAAADWAGEPLELLALCLEVERALGRRRWRRWADRTLDVDLLWIKGRSMTHPRLELPHPRLAERAFALRPLLDVAPDAVDPRTGRRLVDAPPPAAPPLAAVGVLPPASRLRPAAI